MPNSIDWWLFRQNKLKIGDVVNVDLVALSAVFDVWIANCDRWEKNLLLQSEPAEIPVQEAENRRFWLSRIWRSASVSPLPTTAFSRSLPSALSPYLTGGHRNAWP